MMRTIIRDEVQSFEESVETELKRGFESSHRFGHSVDCDDMMRDRLQQLERQRHNLEQSLRNSAEAQTDTQWEKSLLKMLDAFSRRLSLGLPQTEEEFMTALRWISQQGKESKELDLIRTIKTNPPYNSDDIQKLIDIAENNVLERLTAAKYKYCIFCSHTTQNFGESVVVIRRYAAFTIVEAHEQAIAQLQNYYPIERLASVALPPPPEAPHMRDQKVRFSAPILEEWKQRLEALGVDVKILRPIGQYTLVVSVPDTATLEQIKHFAEVEDVSPYIPDIQVQMEYLEHLEQDATVEAIAQARLNVAEPVDHGSPIPGLLIANFFTPGDRDQAEIKLTASGIPVVSRPGKSRLILDLSEHPNPRVAVEVIAGQTGLQSLEEKKLEMPFNDVARQIVAAEVLPPNPHPCENTLGLTGAGEIVAIADTGLDTGNITTLHLDFQGRVHSIQSFAIAPSWSNRVHNPGDDNGAADDHSGHGTHVAGSLIGGGEQAQVLGLAPVKGIAPDAQLIFQAIEQTPKWTLKATLNFLEAGRPIPPRILGGIPDDLGELFAQAYEQGARIHSNSWGQPISGKYNTRCEDLDNFVWDHKDCLIIVAAGNEGRQESSPNACIQPMSLTAPGVAKNCLTVGASENNRLEQFQTTYGEFDPEKFPNPPFRDRTLVDSIDHIAAFSSRGPCRRSERRKPDVLAPGTFILSTRSSQLPDTNYANAPYSPAKRHYMYMHGTSMATPLVAGAAALARQYLRQYRSMPSPSAALVKASIIHSACYILDGRESMNPGEISQRNHPSSDPWADHEQGWGRVSLKNVLNPDSPTVVEFIDDAQGLTTGNERILKLEVRDATVPLRVTLVYTDYPGEGLINNLNVLLLSPACDAKIPNRPHRYWGNDFLQRDRPDRVNNVEGIVVEQPMLGVWTVRVIASAIAEGPQDFALVISGGQISFTSP